MSAKKSGYVPVEAPKKCIDCKKKPPRKRKSKTGQHPQRCDECRAKRQKKQWSAYSKAYQARLKAKGLPAKKAKSQAAKKTRTLAKAKKVKVKTKVKAPSKPTKKTRAKKAPKAPEPLINVAPPSVTEAA